MNDNDNDNDDNDERDRADLLTTFYERHGLVRSMHIDPWHRFMRNLDAAILRTKYATFDVVSHDDSGRILRVKISKIVADEYPRRVDGTPLSPHDAVGFHVTQYVVSTYVEFETRINDVETSVKTFRVKFIDVPVVVGSDWCSAAAASEKEKKKKNRDDDDDVSIPIHREGGYVIMNGTPRVVVPQEQQALNRPIRLRSKNGKSWSVEVRSRRDETGVMSRFAIQFSSVTAQFNVRHSLLKKDKEKLELGVLCLCFGIRLPDVREFLVERRRIELDGYVTVENARERLANRLASTQGTSFDTRAAEVQNFLAARLFPHCGADADAYEATKRYLQYLVDETLLCLRGRKKPDDRDAIMHRRYETNGMLYREMFAGLLDKFLDGAALAMRSEVQRKNVDHVLETFETYFHGAQHTKHLWTCLSKGEWRLPHSKRGRMDVTEELRVENLRSTVSHLRRSSATTTKQTQNVAPREVTPTHAGFVCCSETPESAKTGIAKNLGTCALYSQHRELRLDLLKELASKIPGNSRFIIDNVVLEHRVDGRSMRRILVGLRRTGKLGIAYDVGISYDDVGDAVEMRSDEGRLVQALILVDPITATPNTDRLRDYHGPKNWDSLMRSGVVEILDAQEVFQPGLVVATSRRQISSVVTHMCLWPGALFGYMASMAPSPEMNQCTRLSYYTGIIKGAIYSSACVPRASTSIEAGTTVPKNWSTLQYSMQTFQSPLVTSRLELFLDDPNQPGGINLNVAIFIDPQAQEDSIVLSQRAVDLGAFQTCVDHVHHIVIKPFESVVLDDIPVDKRQRYDEDGIIKPFNGRPKCPPRETETPEQVRERLEKFNKLYKDTSLKPNDVLVAKGIKSKNEIVVNTSNRVSEHEILSQTETSKFKVVVTDVKKWYSEKDAKGRRTIYAAIKLSVYRRPMIGDKYFQRCGQKGVLGGIKPAEDMPYDRDGITPDIIINLQSFPSRQTAEYFGETPAAKLAAMDGTTVDATPFEGTGLDVYRIAEKLLARGIPENGTVKLYNGETGNFIKNCVTMGLVYEHVMRNQAEVKLYARRSGAIDAETGEPAKGRKHGGGMRLGEIRSPLPRTAKTNVGPTWKQIPSSHMVRRRPS